MRSLYFVIAAFLLIGGIVMAHKLSKLGSHQLPSTSEPDDLLSVSFEDLSDDSKETFRNVIRTAIAERVNESWKELKLADQSERELIESLPRFFPNKDAKVWSIYSIHIIKPGAVSPTRQLVKVSTGSEFELRFLRVTANVGAPLAIVQECKGTNERRVVREKVFHLIHGEGWIEIGEDKGKR
jgi:hypothetical protein